MILSGFGLCRPYPRKGTISWRNGSFCRVCPSKSAISWRKIRQRKADITSEREFLVCVYWSVAMGIYLMICSEVTVCILVLPTLHTAAVSATLHFRIRLIYGKLWKDAVADASLKWSVGNTGSFFWGVSVKYIYEMARGHIPWRNSLYFVTENSEIRWLFVTK